MAQQPLLLSLKRRSATQEEEDVVVPHKKPQQHEQQTDTSVATLVICAIGICTCYLYYGMLQEQLVSNTQQQQEEEGIGATFLLVSQTLSNTVVAFTWQCLRRTIVLFPKNTIQNTKKHEQRQHDHRPRLHHSLLLLTAFCYFVAMMCSNESLHYVSYPTAVLAKSCKLIPTMLMGRLVEKRFYSKQEWMGAFCITCGIVLFNISRLRQKQKHIIIMQQQEKNDGGVQENIDDDDDSLFGLSLLAVSLVMDGMLGACQGLLKTTTTTKKKNGNNKNKKNGSSSSNNNKTSSSSSRRRRHNNDMDDDYRPPTPIETMLYVNLYAAAFLLPLTIYTGQWSHGMELLKQDSLLSEQQQQQQHYGGGGVGRGMFLLNATAAAGQVFIFVTIYLYSPLVCTTITTTRKFFTILLSVIHFGHVFTTTQWCCVLLVFGGLYMGIVTKATIPTTTTTTTTTLFREDDKKDVDRSSRVSTQQPLVVVDMNGSVVNGSKKTD